MNTMQIYYRLPIFGQNLATTAQGFVYKRQRYGRVYREALAEYLSRDYTDERALANYQWERAAELIRFAYANSPFYKKMYHRIDIEDVIRSRDITLLPILDKETLREHIEEFFALPLSRAEYCNTSGSTGKSMRFLSGYDDLQRRMAYLDAFKMRHGFVPMKMKRASFSSAKIIPPNQTAPVYWRDNLAIRQRIYSGYHCKGERVKYYVEDLKRFKPKALDGYPSAMYEIAKYINDNKVELGFTPIAAFPTAETLLPHYRAEIEKAFGCPVRDQYASSEGAPFIVECPCGKLHVAVDTGIVEFLEDGRILVTCFETHGTPLIRYDIQDMAWLAEDQNCPCGQKLPVVARIEGRTIDYIQSPRYGRITSVYLSLVSSEFLNSVKAMQFVQNDLYSIDVYVETDERYRSEMNQIIIDKLHYSMGEEVEVRVHRVDEIEKDKSGKFRFIKNNIRNREITQKKI